MQPIEFDPVKSQHNFEQHGFHLSHCNLIDWNLLWAIPDIRKPYGEMRWIAFAPIGKRVFCLVFTVRESSFRVISLRKANAREIQRYEKQIHHPNR